MFATDQPSLIVDGIAVRVVGALAEDRDFTGGFDEPHHAIVRNVRPDEIAARREPGRTFRPARARPQALDAHMTGETSLEARIENDDVRSLDLTIPHRNLRLSILRFCSTDDRSSARQNIAPPLPRRSRTHRAHR